MGRLTFGIAAALLFLSTPQAQAQPADSSRQNVVVEVWLNERATRTVVVRITENGPIWMKAADTANIGLKVEAKEIEPDGYVAVSTLQGVTVKQINAEQQLHIEAEETRLLPQRFDLRSGGNAIEAKSEHGLIGQYDLVAFFDDLGKERSTISAGAALGGTYFSSAGFCTANSLLETNAQGLRAVRLDTAFEREVPETMSRWRLGDSFTGGPGWARSVRFAGLQAGTDFSLRPDLVTMPLPVFFGRSDVPATVDVFVDSARVLRTNVEPGPFQIDNLPVVVGAGQAQIVVRDALGRETVTSLPFFASRALLREDLSAYSLDFGVLRQNYGRRSFDYGDLAGAVTYAWGATNWLTPELHAEAAHDVQTGGASVNIGVSSYGVVHAAAAASSRGNGPEQRGGFLQSYSFESQIDPFGFFGGATMTQGGYADLAAKDGIAPPRLQWQAGANVNMGKAGSFAVSWVSVRRNKEKPAQLATASYTLFLDERLNLAATGLYDHNQRQIQALVSLSFSFGHGYTAGLSANQGAERNWQRADFVKSANPDGGVGYRLAGVKAQSSYAEGEVTWNHALGRFTAGAAIREGRPSMRLGATGGVVAMENALYWTKPPDGAIALVRTGRPDMNIYRENRLAAVTDADGEAILTGLTPYVSNRVSIDPLALKITTLADTTEKTVVPRRRSGVAVDFMIQEGSPALIILKRPDQTPPPAGARVTLDGGNGTSLVVGNGGEVFIADMREPVRGVVTYLGGSCRFNAVTAAKTSAVIARIGPVACIADQG